MPYTEVANGVAAPAKPAPKKLGTGNRSADPTANVPVPDVAASTAQDVAAAETAAEIAAPDAELDALLGIEPEAPAAPAVDPEKPVEATEPEPPKESALLRKINRDREKLAKREEALAARTKEVEAALPVVTRQLEEARKYGQTMAQREQQIVEAARRDPIAVIKQLSGLKEHDLAQALLGQRLTPAVDPSVQRFMAEAAARQAALEQELKALRGGLETGASTQAQARAETEALSIIKTDPGMKHLQTLQPAEQVTLLNEVASKMQAAGRRASLGEIVATAERVQRYQDAKEAARLARITGGQLAAGGAAGATGQHAGARAARTVEPTTPTLSSRNAGERNPVKLDPLDPGVDKLALAEADKARKRVAPKK